MNLLSQFKTSIILGGFALLFLMACQAEKRMKDMADTTARMETTTKHMDETTTRMEKNTEELKDQTKELKRSTDDMNTRTGELEKKTEQMKDTTNEVYDSLRQGNSLQLRREAWIAILEAPTMYKKISEASKYFMSFEFQLWGQASNDRSLAKRDLLLQQAVREFFLEIEELAPSSSSFGNLDIFSLVHSSNLKGNKTAAFTALALAVHEKNRKQLENLASLKRTDEISLLTVIDEALRSKSLMNSGKDLGSKSLVYREILAHEEKAIQILQTRYNVLPLLFVDDTLKFNRMVDVQKGWYLAMGWTLDLDKISFEKLKYFKNEVLEKAVESQKILQHAGVRPELSFTTRRFLEKMKVKSNGKASAHEAALYTEVLDLIKQILSTQGPQVESPRHPQ